MTMSANNEKLTTISKNANVATLINIFTVEPENQQRLVDLLVKVTEEVMCKIPGFICANIHKSLDGKQVANYAQWKSVESFKDMRESVKNNVRYQYMLAEFPKVAKKSEAVLHEVCYTNNP